MSDAIRKFAAISKTETNEDGTIQVFGIASTESVDSQGETVTKGAMLDALPDYFKHGTGPLRSMHQPIAAGFVTKAEVNDAGETEIVATVVDPVEVQKVLTGVYKGFSIGGKKLPGGYDAATKTISKMRLTEISLVDRPANPEAVITMFKGDDIDATVTVSEADASVVSELADLLNKGDISPARLFELAQAEIAKAAKKDDGDDESGDGEGGEDEGATKDKKDAEGSDDEGDESEKAAGAGDDVKKGMYSVSRFAELITSIGYLVSDAEWEADCEKDGSPVPAQLRDWLKTGAGIFQAMAVEEINEFVAQFQSPEATSAAVVSLDVEMSAQVSDLKKSLSDAAAVSLVDYLSIAKAHMPENDIAKSVLADGFEKTTDLIVAKMAPGADLIAKLADRDGQIAKLNDENGILKSEIERLKAQPAPTKATLRVVVEKGQDVADVTKVTKDEPILKADGTIDHEATALEAIKKVHQTGGQRLLR